MDFESGALTMYQYIFFITKSEEVFRKNKNAFLEINSSIWVQRI